jgi:hypothetical protein
VAEAVAAQIPESAGPGKMTQTARYPAIRLTRTFIAGRYFSEELDTVYTIEMGDDGLVLRHRRLDDVELTPKVTDTFNGSGGIADVKFIRSDDGALSGLMASNIRTLNVWFKKQD